MQIYLQSWYSQLKGTLAMVWYLVEKDRLTLVAQKLMTLNIFLSAHGLILILKNAQLSSGSAAHLKMNLARTNVFITTRLCFYGNIIYVKGVFLSERSIDVRTNCAFSYLINYLFLAFQQSLFAFCEGRTLFVLLHLDFDRRLLQYL